jgi:hypothetical protein
LQLAEKQKDRYLVTCMQEKTIIFGKEYDDSLREKLLNAVKRMGGKLLSHDWGVGGSQELDVAQFEIGSELIVIESETYIGLSIRGSSQLVDQISEIVNGATSSSA